MSMGYQAPGFQPPYMSPFGSPNLFPGMNPLIGMGAQFGAGMLAPGMQMGQFMPNQSFMNTLEAQQFQRMQMGLSSTIGASGAAADVRGLLGGLGMSGMLAGHGTPGFAQQSQQIGQIAGQILPFASMAAPGLADALGPGMGQMQFAQQLGGMFRPQMAAPNMPGTGVSMMDTQMRVQNLTQNVYRSLFHDAAGNQVRRPQATHGFGIGQTGSIIAEAQRQGLGPGNLLEGDFNQDAQSLNQFAQQITSPISAIRDVFGPGLTTSQQFQALNLVTLSGTSREELGDLGMQVRQFKQLARAGYGDDPGAFGKAIGLQQMAGQRSLEQGGDISSGVIAGQHALAMGAVAGQLGGQALMESRTSKAQLMQKDALLTAQAANSPVADQMAALMRMGEEGMLSGQAKAKYEELMKGNYRYMEEGDFREMLVNSGVDPKVAAIIRNQREDNLMRYGDKVAQSARNQQWDVDIKQSLTRNIANTLSAVGGKRGLSGQLAMQAGAVVSDAIRESAGQSREEVQAEATARLKELGFSDSDARTASSLALSEATRTAQQFGFSSFGEAALLNNEQILDRVQEQQAIAKRKAEAEARTAAVGQDQPLERVVDAIKGGDTSAATIIAKLLGGLGVDQEKIQAIIGDIEKSEDKESKKDTKEKVKDEKKKIDMELRDERKKLEGLEAAIAEGEAEGVGELKFARSRAERSRKRIEELEAKSEGFQSAEDKRQADLRKDAERIFGKEEVAKMDKQERDAAIARSEAANREAAAKGFFTGEGGDDSTIKPVSQQDDTSQDGGAVGGGEAGKGVTQVEVVNQVNTVVNDNEDVDTGSTEGQNLDSATNPG